MTIALKPNADGSAEIQVNGNTRILISSVGVVTFPGNPEQAIGVGQTWQDLSGSRVHGTTYTNSTGRPIMVAVSESTGNSSSVEARVAGVAIQKNTAPAGAVFSFVVPAGSTYSVNVTAGTSTVQLWSELRT